MTPLGLYLHIPFCRTKCDWCAFASQESARGSEAWLQQILGQLESPPYPDAVWDTVYLGGGTPSLLTPDQLDRLLAGVNSRRQPDAELTMEANPESLVSEHLSVLASRGGTRLSLGVQSFDEGLLRRHNRPTRRVHLRAAQRLVETWSGGLSLDLICGLEGQTSAGQRADIDQALEWKPDHVSFYCLTLEPETPLGRRAASGQARLPGEEESITWWLEGRERLEGDGLEAYEVSNFARPGARCEHNGRYWALQPWWGVGPSAVSFLARAEGGFEYRYEPSALPEWLAGREATIEVPTPLELAKDGLLSGLRRTEGIPRDPWAALLPATLQKWKGRIVEQNGQLFLVPEAFLVMDTFLRDTFVELDGRPEFR